MSRWFSISDEENIIRNELHNTRSVITRPKIFETDTLRIHNYPISQYYSDFYKRKKALETTGFGSGIWCVQIEIASPCPPSSIIITTNYFNSKDLAIKELDYQVHVYINEDHTPLASEEEFEDITKMIDIVFKRPWGHDNYFMGNPPFVGMVYEV
jgi:hypothetical protein